MIALLLPILDKLLGSLITPFLKAWSDYKRVQLTTREQGFAAGAAADAQIAASIAATEVQNNALKVQLYGHAINRAVMWIAGFPAALHFSLVFVDTILASASLLGHAAIGVPRLPAPYDTYEWAVVTSFFLVQGVHLGSSNVAQWLARK